MKIEVPASLVAVLAALLGIGLLCFAVVGGGWHAENQWATLLTNHNNHMQIIDTRLKALEAHPHAEAPVTTDDPTDSAPE